MSQRAGLQLMLKRLKSKLNLKDLPDKPSAPKQDLDAADILRGFKYLSKYLRINNPRLIGSPLTIIVSGGTCSVLYLRNRSSTFDIDFFAHSADELREVLAAKRGAANDMRAYHTNWLSAQMVSYIVDNPACDKLYDESVAQNAVLYQSDVLRVLAADWRFQLVAKIARAHERGQLPEHLQFGKDMADAVSILRVLVSQNGGAPIAADAIRTWYAFGPKLADEEIVSADAAYVAVYGEPGIKMHNNDMAAEE